MGNIKFETVQPADKYVLAVLLALWKTHDEIEEAAMEYMARFAPDERELLCDFQEEGLDSLWKRLVQYRHDRDAQDPEEHSSA